MAVTSVHQALALDREDNCGESLGSLGSVIHSSNPASPFLTVPAKTESLLDRAYRLRYQVYCLERGFEDAAANPDGRERDAFDDHAVHRLLVHAETGLIVGGVRLVLPRAHRLHDSFPLQSVCQLGPLRPGKVAGLARTAEISRFCVSKAFRRLLSARRAEGLPYGKRPAAECAAYLPLMTLELMQAVFQMSQENDIDQLCAAMEPSLLRLLSRLGLEFKPIGPLVSFHGVRQPCHASIDELSKTLKARNKDVWARVTTLTGSPAADPVQ